MKNLVGLFGTCGSSTWRNVVIPILEEAGVEYFNPVVSDWNEEAQRNEVEHAATDAVIVMVITGETTGIASMSELGWQALNAHKNGQKLIVFLEYMPIDVKDEFGTSLRINKTRALIKKYIQESDFVVANSLEDVAELAIKFITS